MIEMTLTLALQAAEATRLKAAALGLAMTVSVVDEAGRLVLTLRGDGTGFLTTDTSRAKAVAALTFKRGNHRIGGAARYPAFLESCLGGVEG